MVCQKSVLCVAILALLAGCNKPAPPQVGSAAPPMFATGNPVTQAEAEEFGEQLELAIKQRDKNAFVRLMRFDELNRRSVSDLPFTDAETKDYFQRNPTTDLINYNYSLFAGADDKPRKIKVIRILGQDDGQYKVLLRIHFDTDNSRNLDYIEIALTRYEDGSVASNDYYRLGTGELYSQRIRRVQIPIWNANHGKPQSESQQRFAEHISEIENCTTLMSDKKYREAWQAFARLPLAVRKEKLVANMMVVCGSHVGDNEFLKAFEAFRTYHPDDPSLKLLSIDYFTRQNQHGDVLIAVDALNEYVGGDPALLAIKAEVLFEMKDYTAAKQAAQQAISKDTSLKDAYYVCISSSLAEDDHDETLRWLKKLVFDVREDVAPHLLHNDSNYTQFVKTRQFAEFQRWVNEQPLSDDKK